MKKKYVGISGIFLVVSVIVSALLAFSWASHKEEKIILKTLRAANNCSGKKMHLSDVVPTQYSEVCVQPPYMQKDSFEFQSRHKAPGFKSTDDHRTYWWLYGQEGETLSVEIPRFEVTERTTPPLERCYFVNRTEVVFSCVDGRPFYYFEKTK